MKISVVIPTYNMAEHLPTLWNSIVGSGLAAAVDEVLFVNDGSTDATGRTIEALSRSTALGDLGMKIRHLDLGQNRGRFTARYLGAEAAHGESILFLDSRLELARGFGAALTRLAPLHPSIVGAVDIDIHRNVFCLYWERSHRAIFRRHYRDTVRPLTLIPSNFDQYLKGTGVFLCRRADFLASCAKFLDRPLFSDDTYLMRDMVEHEPIVIHPDLRILWVPREDWKGFIWRIWNRGPGFAEYHVFERQGAFFWAIMAGLTGLAALLVTLVIDWRLGLAWLLGLSIAGMASVVAFTRNPVEIIRLAPLHFAILIAFGAGAIRGIWVNGMRRIGFYRELRF